MRVLTVFVFNITQKEKLVFTSSSLSYIHTFLNYTITSYNIFIYFMLYVNAVSYTYVY